MQNSKTFLLVLLGILAAFGPFVTDMYLPGLPSMTVYFDTTASMVQLGITTAMLGLGFGQIIVGPLSDKYGRKLPLLLSLWLFIFSTIACICSWSIGAFIFFRFLQGIAGAFAFWHKTDFILKGMPFPHHRINPIGIIFFGIGC